MDLGVVSTGCLSMDKMYMQISITKLHLGVLLKVRLQQRGRKDEHNRRQGRYQAGRGTHLVRKCRCAATVGAV